MLDIRTVESENEVYVSGILNELDIKEGVTKDGRGWISLTADILVDQEINGKMVESIITVKKIANREKRDGGLNKVYDIIAGYKDSLISRAAAEKESQASKITVTGAMVENLWINKNGDEVSNFQINANFLNNKRNSDKDGATFVLSGCVLNMIEEVDKNEDPTGRMLIKFGVVGYNGKMNLITLVAEGNGKAYIEQNWQKGDTVRVKGQIRVFSKQEKTVTELGFGEPIEKTRTVSCRELVITGCTPGLEEDLSYDADSIKQACNERLANIERMKSENKKKAAPPKRVVQDFDDF